MKKLVLSFFAILAALSVQAQEEDAHDFEVGIGTGLNFIAKENISRNPGVMVYGEYRYGLSDHFDIGAQVNYSNAKGKYDAKDAIFNQVELMLVSDWNILSSGKCRPFIGVGLGGAYGKYAANQVKYNYFLGVVDPRLGLQFGRHYKVAFDANLAFERASQKEIRLCAPFTFIGFKIGYIF